MGWDGKYQVLAFQQNSPTFSMPSSPVKLCMGAMIECTFKLTCLLRDCQIYICSLLVNEQFMSSLV